MNEEQKKLFDALSPLQQKIATNVISGMSNIDAYKAAGGKASTQASAESTASEILSNRKVKAFIDEMKNEAVRNAVMTREEMLERLSTLARVSLSDLVGWQSESLEEPGEDGEVEPTQTYWRIKDSAMSDPMKMSAIAEVTAGKEGIKIKQHSPLIAMKQLADLAGYNAAQKFDHQSTDGSMSPKQPDNSEIASAIKSIADKI